MFALMTKAAILSIAEMDKGIDKAERDSLMAVISGGAVRPEDAMVRYRDAARRLNVSLETVKRLARLGKLRKVIGGGKRAIGVSESSINNFVSSTLGAGKKVTKKGGVE